MKWYYVELVRYMKYLACLKEHLLKGAQPVGHYGGDICSTDEIT